MKSLNIGFRGTSFEIFRARFKERLATQNHKSAVICYGSLYAKRYISGRNGLSSSLTTGVLSLPLTAVHLFFRAAFRAEARQTEPLEEATVSVALDEIPSATCEPFEIATRKGLKFKRGT